MQEDPKMSSEINYSSPRPPFKPKTHSSPKPIPSPPWKLAPTHTSTNPFPHAKSIVGDIVEGNLASVHLEECVSGFCLQRGVECGFKWRKERERRGFLGLEHSENWEELREFARKKERKNVGEEEESVLEWNTLENQGFRACRGDFLEHFGCPCTLED